MIGNNDWSLNYSINIYNKILRYLSIKLILGQTITNLDGVLKYISNLFPARRIK